MGPLTPSTPTVPVPASSTTSDWRGFMTDDLKTDPVVTSWAEKASHKDVPAVLKAYAHLSKKMGDAVLLPGKEAKPEEIQEVRQRLYDAGIFVAPPKKPEEYGLQKPESLPDGVHWSPELATKFAQALHKHGVPQAAVGDLLPLYLEAIGGASATLKTDFETGMTELRREFGDKFEERMELSTRMSGGIFKTPEEVALFEQIGLGNDPRFLGPMMRLAGLAAQDSSYLEALPVTGGQISGEAARTELGKIMSDKTHPDYAGYWSQDKTVMKKVEDLYKRAYGTDKVTIGQGISV